MHTCVYVCDYIHTLCVKTISVQSAGQRSSSAAAAGQFVSFWLCF